MMFNLVACASWIALPLHLGCLEVERCPLLRRIRLAVDSAGHERHLDGFVVFVLPQVQVFYSYHEAPVGPF